MTREEDFQQKLTEYIDNHHTRLVLADWLQEHNDPRADGYRALGLLKISPNFSPDERPFSNDPPFYRVDRPIGRWEYWALVATARLYPYGPRPTTSNTNYLPDDWLALIKTKYKYYYSSILLSCDFWTRQEAEDAAARAFSLLPPDRKAELLSVK